MPGKATPLPGAGPDDAAQQVAKKKQHRDEVTTRAQSRGHFDHGDIGDLRQDHSDDEIAQTLVDYFTTPAGQQEMAKAGRGGADPKELARDVMRGR